MLDEARKRDHAANALLGLAFAANAASSPEALVRSGHIESPGYQLMSRMMRKRKEADRNLDSERVSKGSRNRKTKQKQKTFESFITEAQKHFPSRAELEKHHGGIPDGMYANNAGSSENPKWRLKPKSGGAKERAARKERIQGLSSSEQRDKADRKASKIKKRGYEAHHITPTHHSAKLKSSMSDSEWKERVERDKKIGVYHGHQPRNLMATKKSTDPKEKKGVYHRKGGAHELEGKVKDLVSGKGSKESAISHRDLLNAAIRRQRKQNQNK